MYKVLMVAVAVVLTYLATAQFNQANDDYVRERLNYAQTVCETANQSPTTEHLKACSNETIQTGTEYICNPDGRCWLEANSDIK